MHAMLMKSHTMHILNLYEHFGLGLSVNILCKNQNSHNSGVKNYSTMNKDKFVCNKEQVLQNYVDLGTLAKLFAEC